MKITNIPFQKTGYFSTMMCDYLEKSAKINSFYGNFPDVDGFKKQIVLKEKSFSNSKRQVLVEVLQQQYENVKASDATTENIQLLLKENTFTVTTGHQLNLFTGPLYFLYKIISAINLAEELSEKFPQQHFVPVYWMATEDHDFEEINFFNFKGKKVQWNTAQTGAVGRFSTDGLEAVFNEFSKHIGNSKNAEHLKTLFTEGYLQHTTLAEATRYIANELFAAYGLVIIDADDEKLKQELSPFAREELLHQTSFTTVSTTNEKLAESYKIQVNPREINLFYLTDMVRERIVFENGVYQVNGTNISFTKDEMLAELEQYPARFSPNVIMRPLYQEVILPNLCYIGGGGELAYWMQLKDYFDAVEVPFPILLLRNSVQVLSEKQAKKLEKLSVSVEEIFLKQHKLINKKVNENSAISVDFSKQKDFLQQQFDELRKVAAQTDASFIGAVNAQEKKQVKGLETLEKRLLRAEKRKHKELVDRIAEIQNEILPNQSLEERQRNFSEFYLEYGESFVKTLKNNLQPLQLEFTVLKL
ncbi:bacillithiol biosynthesis cysteine-adding enzyme BshC [Tenacibaculum sp. IB213877]|uniref:bacillithiol biosynthesis cysteine-adding enzyme BshC n=1 Tax=Tenacibaculum sp. IB213877 TaxID=3097351 RepID=UPI002A5A93D7|nr:bacillithiol biosynthesis cysteine-adding enzyme BshC [Tenacibaculum sp. IB213877]MDY0781472.1 bacillithiol biosynthesis cysteine-adding enzyme BshC [Tenacibaculum sp. IB213877]